MSSTNVNSSSTTSEPVLVSIYYNTLLLSCILIVILSIVTVVGNGLLLVATWKDPLNNLKSPMSNFVISLATANLLIGLVLEPMIFYQKLTIYQRRVGITKHKPYIVVSTLVWSVSTVLLNASFMTVLVLTWCQVVAVAWPHKYKTGLTTTRSKICVCIVWCYVILFALFHITGAIERKTAYQLDLYVNTTFVTLVLLLGYLALHKAYRMHLKSQSMRQSRTRDDTRTWLSHASGGNSEERKRARESDITSHSRASEDNMRRSRASESYIVRQSRVSADNMRHSRVSESCITSQSRTSENSNTRHCRAIKATRLNATARYNQEGKDWSSCQIRTSKERYSWHSLAYEANSTMERPVSAQNIRITRPNLEIATGSAKSCPENDNRIMRQLVDNISRENTDRSAIRNRISKDRSRKHSRVLERTSNRNFTILILLLAGFVIFFSSPITIIGYIKLHWLPWHRDAYNYYIIASLICNDIILFKFALDPIAYALRLPKYRKAFRSIVRPSNRGRGVELQQYSRRQSDGSTLQKNDNWI